MICGPSRHSLLPICLGSTIALGAIDEASLQRLIDDGKLLSFRQKMRVLNRGGMLCGRLPVLGR